MADADFITQTQTQAGGPQRGWLQSLTTDLHAVVDDGYF